MGKNALHTTPFPIELWDIICDHLSDDAATLRSCSLVCRSWLPTARKRAFRHIHILGSTRYEALDRLLDSPSFIAPYVRHVSITMDGTLTWLDHEAPRILLKLNQVTQLKLRNWIVKNLSQEIRKNITIYFARIKTLYLQDVAFSGDDFPLMIWACPKLSALHLYDVDWRHSSKTIVSPMATSRIETLSFRSTPLLVPHWLSRTSLDRRLRKFQATWDDPSQTVVIRDLLREAGKSLVHASLYPRWGAESKALQDLGLAENTELSVLQIAWEVSSRQWVSELLAQVRSPKIRQINISLYFVGSDDPESDWIQSDRIQKLDWQDIDAHLARLAKSFPSLIIKLNLFVRDPPTQDSHSLLSELREAVLGRLPNVSSEANYFEVVDTVIEGNTPFRPFDAPVQ